MQSIKKQGGETPVKDPAVTLNHLNRKHSTITGNVTTDVLVVIFTLLKLKKHNCVNFLIFLVKSAYE